MADLDDILAEYGVTTIPNKVTRRPRQTHAGTTLGNILADHGEAHLRDVLTCLLEGENNAMALVAPVITAVSRALNGHPDWWERDASRWLDVMDRTDLSRFYAEAKANRRIVPKADYVVTLLCRELAAEFAPPTPELFDERDERART
ncbi:hypothetical protein [Acuticoccus sediminis]|uniref:hypothetical protein n=1 Tax=Acuticoccus sediminis TaxID=2184697 RepID=UPI001CFE8ADA|nr:hypothetical protein [Acuticoccus sediminis]